MGSSDIMQDSDDFWGEEFSLTDADFAALDQAEREHTSTSTFSAAPRPHSRDSDGPPLKRMKLRHTDAPEPVSRSTSDFDDVPDITLGGDGSYSVFAPARQMDHFRPVLSVQDHKQQQQL